MRCALPLILLFGLIAPGCARYEYQIVQPPEFAAHIGKTDHTFTRDPLEYKLRTVDNRLVMRIYNRTEDAITLEGQHSTAVDPDEQSHPLRTQTIAPGSFIKLIFPPPRPRFYNTGPSFGIGVGAVYGRRIDRRGYYHSGVYDDWYDRPRYLSFYDETETYYWDWKGEGQMRLTLVFERGEQKTFTHDFVIGRKRVN